MESAGIDAFFKMINSVLKLTREFQVRFLDALVSYISIVFIRFIMLAVVARRNADHRTFGEHFYTIFDEIQDMTHMVVALSLLLELFKSTMREVFVLSEEKIKELLFYFVNSLPA